MAIIKCENHGRQQVIFLTENLNFKIQQTKNITVINRIEIAESEHIKMIFFAEEEAGYSNYAVALAGLEHAIPKCSLCFEEFKKQKKLSINAFQFDKK